MANLYKDKEGHFTSKENDGGECKHNTNFMSKEDKKMLGIKDNNVNGFQGSKDDEDYEEKTPDKTLERKREAKNNFEMSKDDGWEESNYGEKSFVKNKGKDNEMFIQYNGEDDWGDPEYEAGYMKNGKYVTKRFDDLKSAKVFLNNNSNDKWNKTKFKKGDYVKVTGGRYANFPMLQQIEDYIEEDNEEGGVYRLKDVEGEGSVFNPKYRGGASLLVLPSSLEVANEDEYADDPDWVENKRLKHNPRYKYLKAFSGKFKQ